MPDDDANFRELLQRSIDQVHELYNDRPLTSLGTVLRPFSGAANEPTWSEWERQFSRVAMLTGASSFTRKVALLSTYVRGPASALFSTLESRVPTGPLSLAKLV